MITGSFAGGITIDVIRNEEFVGGINIFCVPGTMGNTFKIAFSSADIILSS